MRIAVLPLLLLSFALCCPSKAQAQRINRCTSDSGAPIYTDKRCEDVGAMQRLPDPDRTATPGARATAGESCPRTLSSLVQRIGAAIDAQDVNRLAWVYQWRGVSDDDADRILGRLEAVVQRPLVDIVPVRPPPAPLTDDAGNIIDMNEDGYYPQAGGDAQHPTGLRVRQTLKNGATPSSTVFGLRRSYNCFWITL